MCFFVCVFLLCFRSFFNIEISIFSHLLRYDIDIYKNIDIRYNIAFDMPTTTVDDKLNNVELK